MTTPKIFLSHSSADRGRLKALVAAVKELGLPLWFDEDEIGIGDPIPRAMGSGIAECGKLLVAWSRNSQASDHVWNELDAFYIQRPHPGHILFMCLDDTPVPTLYAARRYFQPTDDVARDAAVIAAWAREQRAEQVLQSDAELPEPHFLHAFPRGPMVQAHWISDELVSAYAAAAGTQVAATMVVNKAIRMRLDADPGDDQVTTVRHEFLPALSHTGPYEFWYVALVEACRNGPRMLAALLLAQPDDLFPAPARKARARLLQQLREMGRPPTE